MKPLDAVRHSDFYTPPLLVMNSVRYRSYSCVGCSTWEERIAVFQAILKIVPAG